MVPYSLGSDSKRLSLSLPPPSQTIIPLPTGSLSGGGFACRLCSSVVESGLVCDAVIRLFLDVSINLRFCYIPHLRTHIERERERESERGFICFPLDRMLTKERDGRQSAFQR